MTRRRRIQRESRSEYLLGVLVILVILAIISSVTWLYLTKPPGVSKANLCPIDGPKGRYVILIDKTDPLTLNQTEALKSLMLNTIEKAPKGYMVSVFVLGEDFKESTEPVVEKCNPGNAKNASDLTSNVEKLRNQYNNEYVQAILSEYSSKLKDLKPANISPIFEMLQFISVKSFGSKNLSGEKRLIIISDMLHNTPQFSMFRSKLDFKVFASSDFGLKQTVQLKDVDVEINFLLFQPQIQKTADFKTFWESYFAKANANMASYMSRPLGF
jgi:hypothetical protein